MKTLAKIRLMSLALLALLLLSSAFISNQAQANFKPDVDIRVFHNALAPYGTWVNHQTYGQVWYPSDVDKNWRPYSDGHWAHTEQYGWLWVSNQKWGWAPFHYGRWSLDGEYGWIWIPGRTWAPAWVFWRYGGGYAAWAPIPPNAVWESNVGLNTRYFNYDRDLSYDYWIAVHEYDLPHPYVSRHIIPRRQNAQICHVTHNINYVTIINKTIVNTGVPVKVIEKAMGHSVPFVKPVVIDDASKPIDNDSSKPIIIQPKDITSPSAEDNKKDMDLAKQLDASSPVQTVNTPPANTDPKTDAITPEAPPLSGQPVEPLPVNNPNPTPVNSDILPPASGSATEATPQTEPPVLTSAPQSVDPLSANLPVTTPVNDGILPPVPVSATEISPQAELPNSIPAPIDPSLAPISPSIETGPSNPCTLDCVPPAGQSVPPAPETASTAVTPDSSQGEVINHESLPGQAVGSLPVNNLNPTPVTDDLSSPVSNPLPETPSQAGSESTPVFQPVQPELQAQPEPSYQPEPQTQPDASYQSAPQAQPEPSYQPAPQAQPEPSYQPEPQAQPEPSYQPAPQAQPEPSYQSEPQAQPEPSYQSEPQAQPEPSYQPEPQAQPEPS